MSDSATRRRVLLLSYYFPPSGGSGVQRPLKWSRYLPDEGWDVTVIAPDPNGASYPDLDPSLTDEVPSSVRIVRTRSWDPYAAYARLQGKKKSDVVATGLPPGGATSTTAKLAAWLRGNVFLPDARVAWVPFAARAALAEIRRAEKEGRPYDALITTGPPHSTHLAGLIVRHLSRVPWMADLRDPWTEIYYYDQLPRSAVARVADRAMERAVLSQSDAVVTIGDVLAERFAAIGGREVEVVRNGYDAADFEGDAVLDDRTFTVAFVGTFVKQENAPGVWDALAELRASGAIPDLRLRLVGAADPAVIESLDARGLLEITSVEGYVPHADAIDVMQRSHLLLLPIPRTADARLILTGKLYEYLASGRRVLGIGPVDGEAARLLEEAGAGSFVDWDDVQGARRVVYAAYHAWHSGAVAAGAPASALPSFTRRAQAAHLARLLGQLVDAA